MSKEEQAASSAGAPAVLIVILILSGIFTLIAMIYSTIVNGFWRTAWIYYSSGLRIFLSALVFLALAALCVGIWASILFLLSRKRKIKVFISYNHRDEKEAAELAKALSERGYIVMFNPMVNRELDEIVDIVRQQMHKMDVVLALPGQVKDSFANSEILSAATLEKPVVLVVASEDSGLAHTALSGYPVFLMESLKATSYLPLDRFLRFVFNHHKGIDVMLKYSLQETQETLGIIMGFTLILLFCWYLYWRIFFAFIDTQWLIGIGYWITGVAIAISSTIFLIGAVRATLRRFQALRAVRQSAGSRQFTYSAVSGVLDQDILSAMAAKPLRLMDG